jgi:hypothetical protein
MKIAILCQTHGRDLQEFMFRPHSNVAITIMANIAVEAAGLVYQELRWAAKGLHREQLWVNLSSPPPLPTAPKTTRDAYIFPGWSSGQAAASELLKLCKSKPLEAFLEMSNDTLLAGVLGKRPLLFDPLHCIFRLKQDPAFLPFVEWSSPEPSSVCHHLFYVDTADVFIHIEVISAPSADEKGEWNIELVERDESTSDAQPQGNSIAAAQKLVNFVLHMVWSDASRLQ